MGMTLKEDPHSRKRIEEYFKNSQYKTITDNNWKQALVPEGAIVLDNENGTAPGIIMEKKGKSVILLPDLRENWFPCSRKRYTII